MADNNPHSKSKFYEYLCLFHKKLFTLPMVKSSGRKNKTKSIGVSEAIYSCICFLNGVIINSFQ